MTEYEEQVIVVKWLRGKGHQFFAVPNAAKRNPRATAKLKAEGMQIGAPDLVIVTRPPKLNGVHVVLEMKQKTGAVSDDQAILHVSMTSNGWIVLVGYGAEDAIAKLERLGY